MNRILTFKAEAEESRREKFNGIEHLVIPVIALVEGVIQSANSEKPELALAQEFGNAPGGWNGRPVTINHPEIKGQKVSANSPEVLESEQIGQLFNTVLDGKKLKTEAWIDIDKANDKNGEISKTVKRLLAGDIVEISTGLFSNVDEEEGTHDGEKFFGVWRNVVPDHLAILTKGNVGACSIADGCGANRMNAAGEPIPCDNCTCSLKEKNETLASNKKTPDDVNGGDKSIFERLKDLVSFTTNKELSHNSIRSAVNAVLAQEDGWAFLVDVFSKHVIVEKEGGLFRRNFKITTSGKVKLDTNETPVRFEADFVDLKTNEEDKMDKDKFVADLIANEGSKFEEGDKKWLEGLDEKQLEKLAPVEAKVEGVAAVITPEINALMADVKEDDLQKTVEEALRTHMKIEKKVEPKPNQGVAPVTPKTVDEYVDAAPLEIQALLKSSLRTQADRKAELLTLIKANAKNKFSDKALSNMDLENLENLAALAETEDYSTRSGPRMNVEDPNAIPAPIPVFDLSKAS